MALFCATISKDSVSFLRFPFHDYALGFSGWVNSLSLEILIQLYSSHFCFQVVVVLFVLIFLL